MGSGIVLAIIGGVVLLGVLILVVLGIGIYNKLTQLRERYKNAFAQIDVQLQRRYDLIPNLVETAKGYMAHERDTLEAVIAARNQAMGALQAASANPGDPGLMAKLNAGEGMLSGALGRLMAVAEAYPDLKANQNMMQLSEELTTTENKVSFSRQAYNDIVMSYNAYRKTFPPVIFAGLFGHATDAEFYEIPDKEAAQKAPKVDFS
ncbi:MAG: LemA family protein [Phycisphaerales bacterium]